MTSLQTEAIAICLTPHERMLIEGLVDMRQMTVSDLVRELVGLEREGQIQAAPPRLRLVSA